MTTRHKSPKRQESFAAGVGRGMRRAARTAREVARNYRTPIYVWENGKVVVTLASVAVLLMRPSMVPADESAAAGTGADTPARNANPQVSAIRGPPIGFIFSVPQSLMCRYCKPAVAP
jgi:hypothetical protein